MQPFQSQGVNDGVCDFLIRKWSRESGYELINDILVGEDNRMAVRFCYEHHNASGDWFCAHSN